MSDDAVPYHRFKEVNDRVRELEAALGKAQTQAKAAEKLATQVTSLREAAVAMKAEHESALAARAKHDVLRDKGIDDADVRDLFLGKLGEVDDLGAALDAMYAEGADVPALLRPFLPERQSETAAETPAPAAPAAAPPGRRLPQATGRAPAPAPVVITEQQLRGMTNAELAQQLPALARQYGVPELAEQASALAPPKVSG